MNYITQLNAFNERCHITGTKPLARVVYYTLLDMNNAFRWCSEFKTTVRIIAARSGMTSINTVHRCIEDLVHEGLIEYYPSKAKGKKSTFKIIPLCSYIGTETGTKTGTETGTTMGTTMGTKTATLNKQNKIKQKTINRDVFFESKESDTVKSLLNDFSKMRDKIKKPMTDKAKELLLSKLDSMSNGDERKKIALLEQSIEHCWQTLYELKENLPETPTLSPEEEERKKEENKRRNEAAMAAYRAKVEARYGGVENGDGTAERSAS